MRLTPILLAAVVLTAACDDAAEPALTLQPPPRGRDAATIPNPGTAPADDAGASDGAAGDEDAAAPDDRDGGVPVWDSGAPPPPPADAAVEPDPDAARPPPRDAAVEPDPDAAAPPPPDDISEECRLALRRATFTFEDGAQGWTHAPMDGVAGRADWPFDAWEQGTATSGPGSCHEGRGCWATSLHDNLVQCQRADLRSPEIDLRACADRDLVLVFDHWYAFWSAADLFDEYYDGGTVEAGNVPGFFETLAPDRFPGTIAINPELGFGYSCIDADNFYVDGLPGYVGESGGWVQGRHPLGDLHRNGPFRLRFAYGTGVSAETTDPDESQFLSPPGWYVDFVRFEVRAR